RRFLQSLFTLIGVLTVTFFLVRFSGDPTTLLLPVEASSEDIARFRNSLGLDQSWLVQYWKFLASVIEGDFGISLRHRSVQLAGSWAIDRAIGEPAGLSGHYCRCVRGVPDLCRDQSSDRSPLRLARSARTASMIKRGTFTTWVALFLLACVLSFIVVVPL